MGLIQNSQGGLKFTSVKEARSEHVRTVDYCGCDSDKVPVIDFSKFGGPDRELECEKLVSACVEWGFFQVVNHGVNDFLLNCTKDAARGFFDLPDEEKLKFSVVKGSLNGYHSRKVNAVAVENQLVNSVDHFVHVLLPSDTKNERLWPRHTNAYQKTIESYGKAIQVLAEKLLTVLSEALCLPPSYFVDKLKGTLGQPSLTMRINFYPSSEITSTRLENSVSLGSHSDPGGLTLLLQGDVAGLQVKKGQQWMDVEPIPDAFVVNIGDQLEVLTNGLFKSVDHRGLSPTQNERLSLATFYSPNSQETIGPAPEFVDEKHPPLYGATKYRNYMTLFKQKGLDSKSLLKSMVTNS